MPNLPLAAGITGDARAAVRAMLTLSCGAALHHARIALAAEGRLSRGRDFGRAGTLPIGPGHDRAAVYVLRLGVPDLEQPGPPHTPRLPAEQTVDTSAVRA